jgi:hypothetical protein
LRFGRRTWQYADSAIPVAISLLLLLYMVDCLMNAMANPIYPLCLGALTTVYAMRVGELVGENEPDESSRLARLVTVSRQTWPPAPALNYAGTRPRNPDDESIKVT